MAKNTNNSKNVSKTNAKKKVYELTSMVPMLYIGVVVVFGTALLQSFFPNFPEVLRNILYFIGIMAFLVYMFQIAFEKRTGKSEAGGENKKNRLPNRK